ncbi:hypothetical protein GCM10025760_06430 [Microbacterium yannicii]|uniref:Uncharacterized protein n=1 Tax=Microbacterium yannicii TaxID=671622 RepID=A0ABP9M198_9MICO|nr:hypothetical protein [Microbacterium yannicii]MCO5954085.1 hypothetical protein [Microbacterium yannicii]
MTLGTLRDDALTTTPGGFRVRLSLPWIRSLPLWSVRDLDVAVDGLPVQGLTCVLGERSVPRCELSAEQGWWFLQDRLTLEAPTMLASGSHRVAVSFSLAVPYLQAGPDGPLTLPFRIERALELDAGPEHGDMPTTGAKTADRPASPPQPGLDPEWTLAASAFNWTPEVVRADRPATDIAVDIVADGIAEVVELEPGQLWRSFPQTTDAEAEELRDRLAAAGGRVSIVGASLDDWASPTRRRPDTERLDFLLPQLHAAQRVGAEGVRLPAGQAGPALLGRLLPHLHDLGLTLYEEVQGQQTPSSPEHAAAYDAVVEVGDARVRLLLDISMLMPALPVSYLERLEAGGIPSELVARLRDDWRDPATHAAVVTLLRTGGVPPTVQTLYMNLLVRFGRSDAADLRGMLPLVGAVHLKFWDLDDVDGRVSRPIHELARELAPTGFSGTLCSEWGGHEWLDDDPAVMTSAHLALARSALAQGAASVLAL